MMFAQYLDYVQNVILPEMRSVVEAQEDTESQAHQLKLELIKKLKMTRLSCEPEDPNLYEDVEEENKNEVPFEMKIYWEAKACS